MMEDQARIQTELLRFLDERISTEHKLNETTDLIASGIIDSLLLTDLVLYIQASFGVEFQMSDVTPSNFRSVCRLAELIQGHRQTGQRRAA